MNIALRARFYLCILLMSVSFATATNSWSQRTLGAVNGTVTDTSGAVLPKATVTITNNGTNLTRQTVAAGNRSYAFQDLPIGTYTVTIEKEGFDKQTYPTIDVISDRTVTLNAQLKAGSISESVTVQDSPLLNAVDTTNGYTLDNSQVLETPLATGSFTQLAILAPGVNAQFLNGTGTNEGLGNQAIWANGQRATDNTFTLNGIDTTNAQGKRYYKQGIERRFYQRLLQRWGFPESL
jgi:hypothetical protein